MRTRRSRRPAAALLVLGLIAAACTQEASEDPAARPPPAPTVAPSPTPELMGTLMLAHGSRLFRYDIEQDERELITVRGENHAVSPDGTRIAYELPASPDGSPNPQLELVEVDNPYEIRVLGQGREPVWSPDSYLIAAVFLHLGLRICDVEEGRIPKDAPVEDGCTDGERVVVFHSRAEGHGLVGFDPALGPDLWRIVGWTEDNHILGRSRIDGHAALGFPDASEDDVETVGPPVGRVRDVAPVEPLLLIRRRDGVFLEPAFESELVIGETANQTRLDLPDGARVRASTFSPQGDYVALIVRADDLAPHVVVADASTGKVSPPVTYFADPHGPLVWHPDGSHFAFVAGDAGRGFGIVLCSLELYCREVYSSGRPIELVWFGPPDKPEQGPETPQHSPGTPSPQTPSPP